MNLKTVLDEFAKDLRKKASQKDTPLQEATDAFKALTAYYAAQQKGRKKSDPDEGDDSGGFSFGEVSNGGRSKVSARRDS